VAGEAKKGGHLRVGIVGGSAKDTADAHTAGATEPTIAVTFQLYEALFGWDPDYQLVPLLAEDFSASADATVWTIKLRKDVLFHDGRPLTADDVVFSYNRIINPDNPLNGSRVLSLLTPEGIKKVDAHTVEFTLTSPNAIFNEAMAYYITAVVPENYDPTNLPGGAIGTGPFKLKSFSPGQQIEFVRNDDYWGTQALVDELTLVQFADTTARVNALLGGSVDAISQLPKTQGKVVESADGLATLRSNCGAWEPFNMRIDKEPFTDNRVRQAFRLLVDRQQMVDQAYAGYGWVGNDMYAPFDPGYPKDLPQREQDIEQAKSLLKQAGQDDLRIELTTSEAIGGAAVAAAQVFARQAKEAGVTVNVKKVDSAVFFGDQYIKWTFSNDFWYTRNYLTQTVSGTQPTAAYNATHWAHDGWLALVQEAFRTVDDQKRNELVSEAMTIEYNEGGLIVWAFNDQLDGYSEKLGGVEPDKFGAPLSSWHLSKFYFA
jgi:peptide/nickel transport system substrate-binding protein